MSVSRLISISLPLLILLACGSKTETSARSSLDFQVTGGRGIMYYVYTQPNETAEKSEYLKVSKSLCRSQDVCIVMFWDDKESMPKNSEPLTDKNVETKVAHYNVNRFNGVDRLAICSVDGC